jgi:hypothetical protein
VEQKEKLASPERGGGWTRPDAYLVAMARKRSFRRAHAEKPRTQPETPRLLLSTVPFLLILGLLAVVAVGIMILAFPGNQPQPRPKQPEPNEQGVARRGWFQEAQKQFHK